MYVCVEAPGQKTLSDNAGALGKSVKADINMIKGTREKKKSHHKNFGEIWPVFHYALTDWNENTSQSDFSDSAFWICPYKTAILCNHFSSCFCLFAPFLCFIFSVLVCSALVLMTFSFNILSGWVVLN